MSLDFNNLSLKQSREPTQEELLAEAKAWGFDTVEELFAAMEDKAVDPDAWIQQ